MSIILDPKSIPKVKSYSQWNLISRNFNIRHDLPTTPASILICLIDKNGIFMKGIHKGRY